MPFRPSTPALLLGLTLLAAGASRAEDPFLGQIREIKCVNCKPGWVTLVVHDPIETRDFELYLKDTDYNKIVTPLPGKRIHDRNGECFYWMEKPKAAPAKAGEAKGSAQPTAPLGKGATRKAGAAARPETGKGAAKPDTASMLPVSDSGPVVPPPSREIEGTPSSCIRFYKQMN